MLQTWFVNDDGKRKRIALPSSDDWIARIVPQDDPQDIETSPGQIELVPLVEVFPMMLYGETDDPIVMLESDAVDAGYWELLDADDESEE